MSYVEYDPITDDEVTERNGAIASDGSAYTYETLNQLVNTAGPRVVRSPMTRLPLEPELTWYGVGADRKLYTASFARQAWANVTYQRQTRDALIRCVPGTLWAALYPIADLIAWPLRISFLEVELGKEYVHSQAAPSWAVDVLQVLQLPVQVQAKHLRHAILHGIKDDFFLHELMK